MLSCVALRESSLEDDAKIPGVWFAKTESRGASRGDLMSRPKRLSYDAVKKPKNPYNNKKIIEH